MAELELDTTNTSSLPPAYASERPPELPAASISTAQSPVALTTDSTISSVKSPIWHRGPGFWRSFIAICIPLLLSAFEGSITNTALPTISSALDLNTKFSWVATSFLLASTIFQPLYAQLSDLWGRKYPMMLAVLVFGIGSAICGASQHGAVLIFGRIVQGLGTSGIDLFAEMILCDIIPLRRRGPYLALKYVAFATGTTLGPLLGGVFAEKGWRWCFLINIPVCFVSLIVLSFWLQVSTPIKEKDARIWDELKKIDHIGSGILTASVVMILVALSTGGSPKPWSHPAIIVPLVLGSAGIIMFALWETSVYCIHPIMPREVFSNRTTNVAFALTTIHGFVTYGFQFYLPPFFQAVKGSSPTRSGTEVLPTTLTVVVFAAIGGPILSYWGRYKAIHIIGFACMTLGTGLCIMLDSSTPVGVWMIYQLVAAIGIGIVVSTMLPAVQVKLPESSTAASAGVWAFLRGTGSLFGVAGPGAVFNARFAQILPSISSTEARGELAHGQAYQRASAQFINKFAPEVQLEVIHAYTESLKCVWIVLAGMALIGFFLTWLEREYKMRKELDTAYGLSSLRQEKSLEANQDVES